MTIKYPSIEQFKSVIKEVTHNHRYAGKDENGYPIYNNEPLPTLNFTGTTKIHGCFEKDTPITMADGSSKKISEIIIGDMVLSYNIEANKIEPQKIINIFKNFHDKKWVRLTFNDKEIVQFDEKYKYTNNYGYRTIICTAGHLFYTLNRGWIKAKKLSYDDNFLNIYHENYTPSVKYLGDVKGNDRKSSLVNIEKYPTQDEYDIEVESNNNFFANGILVHNSNGGVRFDKSGTLTAQSRERDLSFLSDNNGFCTFVFKHEKIFRELCKNLIQDNDQVVIYGEWFGSGINAGVAVNQLSKRFAIFGIRWVKEGLTDLWADTTSLNYWLSPFIKDLNANDIYNITQFGVWNIDIDFNRPEMSQNRLIEITNEIERECPVGRYFGVFGVGEGAVWSYNNDRFHQFKVKGEKHQNSKVKTLAPVDEEILKNTKEFAENFVTEARLKQGIQVMQSELLMEPIPANTGNFIKWIVNDIIKEEQENMLTNNLDPKKVAREIGTLARVWYLNNI